MKRALTLIFAIATLALGMAAAVTPNASAHTVTRHATAQRCNLNNDRWKAEWGRKDAGTVPYLKAEWTANPCGQHIHVRDYCRTATTNQDYWTQPSGSVKAVHLWTERDCGLDEEFLIGQYQLRYTGSWGNWHNLCAPCARRGTLLR